MEFKRNIYKFDVKQFAAQLLPVKLRGPKLQALVRSLVSPVEYVNAAFVNFKKEQEYELTITGQVCYLQKMLNDFFDYSDRRILVEDVPVSDQYALYLKSEGPEKGLVTYLNGEADPEYTFILSDELGGEGGYFLVKVPAGLVYDVERMKALLNKYKLPTTAYNIVEV